MRPRRPTLASTRSKVQRIPQQGIVGIAALIEAASGEFGQIVNLVRAALAAKMGYAPDGAWQVNMEAVFADRVIVCRDGRYWAYDYTIGADNQVTLADPVEVVENYVPVALREALASATFLEARDAAGSVWDAVLIRAGVSKNGTDYPPAVLREAAPLFDGARVYAKPDDMHIKGGGRDVSRIVGWISGPRFVEGANHIAGQLNFAAGAVALRDTITDAWRRGKRDLVGLSIDAVGKAKAAMREGAKRVATAIEKVNSVDLIVEPSAGGGLLRLVEAAANEDDTMKQRMLEAIKAKLPAKYAAINTETVTDDELETLYREAVLADAPAPKETRTDGVSRDEVAEIVRMTEARASARIKIYGAKLPKPAQDRVWAGFETRATFTEADVDAAIKQEREYLAPMIESGRVNLPAFDIQVEDRSKKVAEMLDAFFDPQHKQHRHVQSFKECYIEITGDRRVTGRWDQADRSRLAEAVGADYRESLDSSSWANVLGNSMTRRMIADYQLPNRYDLWRRICNVVPVNDFRTQERTRYGGYGDLPTVLEGDAYQSMSSPTDEKATYAIAKKGGTEDVTLEMVKNDDVGAIRGIPVKLSRASKRTLSKFVFDFVRTNPTLWDSVAFFHASHGNLGSAALDATSLAARRLAMLKQTEKDSSERLGIPPARLVVPLDLEEGANNLFNRNTNLDKTFVNSMSLEIIPVWYWTDTNDWAMCADPVECPGIEVAFLDGNEEPELFVQDNPSVFSMFSNDKIVYKVRHIFGGQVVEYRGWDKSVV
jgi:hypothetical protein